MKAVRTNRYDKMNKAAKAEYLLRSLSSHLSRLHRVEVKNNHFGDDPDTCSYCHAINTAENILRIGADMSGAGRIATSVLRDYLLEKHQENMMRHRPNNWNAEMEVCCNPPESDECVVCKLLERANSFSHL